VKSGFTKLGISRNIRGYAVYIPCTIYINDIPCISMDIPCIYCVDIHGVPMDIPCISNSRDIHGISMDIACLYHVYVGGLHIHGIY
jgi:hypothetical protein